MARSIATALELDIGDRMLGYTLHRIVGRKHVHLVVDEDARLQVRAPWRFSAESAAEVIIENLLWIRDALERAVRTRVVQPPLVSGTRLPLLDEELRLEYAFHQVAVRRLKSQCLHRLTLHRRPKRPE